MIKSLNLKSVIAILLVLIIASSILMIPTDAFAAAGTIKTTAKLREKPSVASNVKILATLSKGTSVDIQGTSGSYYKVKSGSKVGYVKTSEVTTSSGTPSSTAIGVVGKIEIPNLVRNKKKIDYEVACAKDNKYYLTRDTKGKTNVNGAIFMDFRNQDPTRRRNIILYGHNMKDGSMFAGLHYYGQTDGPTKYKKIYFTFRGEKVEYEPIIIGMIDIKKDDSYINTQFANDAAFTSFIKTQMDNVTDMKVSSKEIYKSWIKDGYSPSASDQILTLSTCVPRTIKGYAGYKWVVICRKVGVVK